MFQEHKKRRGISTVLTTMIILVASVVLGTGVVIYGTSLFQTGAQLQAISVQGTTVWVNATDSTGLAWGAAAVRNSGDKLVSVDQIVIRGTTVPFSNWYVDADQLRVDTDNFQSQFVHNGTDTGNAHGLKDTIETGGGRTTDCTTISASFTDALTIEYDFDGVSATKPTLCMKQASGPIGLNPGERMIVYFKLPAGVLSPVDAGSTAGVSIFAGQAGAPTSVTIGNP